jgi:hypothetical protein
VCVRHELGGCSAENSDGTAGTRADACETVASAQRALVSAVEPLLMAYGVDVYHAGHVHDYESTWPISNGSITQPSYHAPQGRRSPVARCALHVARCISHGCTPRACVRACSVRYTSYSLPLTRTCHSPANAAEHIRVLHLPSFLMHSQLKSDARSSEPRIHNKSLESVPVDVSHGKGR